MTDFTHTLSRRPAIFLRATNALFPCRSLYARARAGRFLLMSLRLFVILSFGRRLASFIEVEMPPIRLILFRGNTSQSIAVIPL